MISTVANVPLLGYKASSNTCPQWEKLNKSLVCFGAQGTTTVNFYGHFFLVFCSLKKPHCVFANSELRLWYGKDLRGQAKKDNGGQTYVDVFGLLLFVYKQ